MRKAKLLALAATWALLSQASRVPAAEEPIFTAITNGPISQAWAFSAAWGDYNRDGFIDLLTVDAWYSAPTRGGALIYLFENQRNGAFSKRILDTTSYQHSGYLNGALWGDYDNDDRPDILVSGGGLWVGPDPNILLHQEPDGTFSRSASPAFPTGFSQSGIFGDFDHDGLLDVFVGYWTGSFPSGDVTDRLYRNEGNGLFTDSMPTGIHQFNNNDDAAMAATTGDFDGDGRTDIIVTTISPNRSRIYFNRGNQTFDRVLATPSAPGSSGDYGNGVAVADYDNDGDLDFLTVSKSGSTGWSCACDGSLPGLARLWRNDGSGVFQQVTAGALGYSDTIGANAAAWADYNNDGWLDVALFRGIYSNGRGRDPADLLYRNNGDGTFTRVTDGPIVNEDGDSRAGAWGDIDNDGDMDLVVPNYRWGSIAGGSSRRPVLYRNEGNDNYWLTLSLSGTVANRDAIGAKVRVKATINGEEVWQLREVHSSTGWIPSQNDPRPHFGLGDAAVAELVRVEWPSGLVSELKNVPANQILSIVEAPSITIASAEDENTIVLSWPVEASGFDLLEAESPVGPWTPAKAQVVSDNGMAQATVSVANRMKFYQLQNGFTD